MSSTAVHKDLPTHQAYQTQQAPCSISEALINLRLGIQNADKDRNERCWLKTGLADFDEAFQGLRRGAVAVLAGTAGSLMLKRKNCSQLGSFRF